MDYKMLADLLQEAREATDTTILKEITWYQECKALAVLVDHMEHDPNVSEYETWLKRVELTRRLLSIDTKWGLYVVYQIMKRCQWDSTIPF